MKIRKFDFQNDYEQHSSFYRDWKLPETPKTWIPEDTYVVEEIGQIICSGSLYQLGGTAMFLIEGIITNKNTNKNLRKESLDLIINHLVNIAKEKGAEIIMASTPRDGLKNMFEDNKFMITPEKYYHLGRLA
jgi:hypothetical protein